MSATNEATSIHVIRVSGLVQGVGFRPWVWRLAATLGVHGQVYNQGCDVVIECGGAESAVNELIQALHLNPPQMSRVDSITVHVANVPFVGEGFSIAGSVQPRLPAARSSGPVPMDLAPCVLCLSELNDPNNRRYGYAFISCTQCGPRFSIMNALPFDRARTSMSAFPFCDCCAREYDHPQARRFHAQTNTCPQCGPQLQFTDSHGVVVPGDPMQLAHAALRRGEIIAVKGVGGFQLVVDATNTDAVERLRVRKHRPHKPLALMAANMEVVAAYVRVAPMQRCALESPEAPIVLMKRYTGAAKLPGNIAPGVSRLGFMLPSSPLHVLLLQGFDTPLVVTSGNLSGGPQYIDNHTAVAELVEVADGFLLHDRAIINRLDDSVVQVYNDRVIPLRLGRGYAPIKLLLPEGFETTPNVLAMGADLKNSFCLMSASGMMLSPYNGDLSEVRTLDAYEQRLATLTNMFDLAPEVVAVDFHPGYHSTTKGKALGAIPPVQLQVLPVQHHHAHLAACLAENGRPLAAKPVLGIILDGLGFGGVNAGSDEPIWWGGEVLLGDYLQYQRLACLAPVALPGGDAASRQPWRNALSHLHSALGWDAVLAEYGGLDVIKELSQKPVETVLAMMQQGVNSPLSSSCGRLFDAVAVLLGICTAGEISYEGQAAMGLQSLAEGYGGSTQVGYPMAVEQESSPLRISLKPMWKALLADLAQAVPAEQIAYRFHRGLAEALVQCCTRFALVHDVNEVVLSGGVFQNLLLLHEVSDLLQKAGFSVLTHTQVPPNDGCIAVGQAVVAAANRITEKLN